MTLFRSRKTVHSGLKMVFGVATGTAPGEGVSLHGAAFDAAGVTSSAAIALLRTGGVTDVVTAKCRMWISIKTRSRISEGRSGPIQHAAGRPENGRAHV